MAWIEIDTREGKRVEGWTNRGIVWEFGMCGKRTYTQARDKESINKVLDWMEALNAVNTDDVKPLVHMTPAMNQFRSDVAKQDLTKEKALALGPDTNEQYFKVPQVIE